VYIIIDGILVPMNSVFSSDQMKFVLLSANVIVMVLLVGYLLNLFSLADLSINVIGFLFFASLTMALIANHIIEEYKIANPLFFVLPGLAAALTSVLMLKQVSVVTVLGMLFLIPGVMLTVKKKK